MRARFSYLFCLALLINLWLTSGLVAQNRPNILIVIADDMGTDAFEPYGIGTDLASTPVLNNLASQGLLFMNAWGYPSCAPSRAALLTGRYGNKTSIMRSGPNLPNSEITLFEHLTTLTNDAYANAVFGKWHLGNNNHPNNNGVQNFDGNLSSNPDSYFTWERVVNGVADTVNTYVTTYLTDQAISWIDQQSKPWLCWMAYNAPHSPFHLPPDSLYTRTQTNSNRDLYKCMIESVDHEVGRLLNSLTQAERDSTLIIFVGDNGSPGMMLQGYPQGQGKTSMYEGGIRVPMFATGYGVSRVGEQEAGMVHFVDLFATLTEMLGTALPGGVNNSFSFYSLLSDAHAPTRPYNYAEYQDGGINRAVRNAQYKLILRDDGSQEMYDLWADSFETADLLLGSLTSDQSQVRDELAREADSIFSSWSCNDGIQNGNEAGIDCGGTSCAPCGANRVGEGEELTRFKLYPNPAQDEVFIRLDRPVSKVVEVCDFAGKRAFLTEIHGSGSISLAALPPGLYIITVSDGRMRQAQKFMIR
ncbi:MAG: sulfatase-like hydrolase/transferase [Bacteroidota bacterium]